MFPLILFTLAALFLYAAPKERDVYGHYSFYLYFGLVLAALFILTVAPSGFGWFCVAAFLASFTLYRRIDPRPYTRMVANIGCWLLVPLTVTSFIGKPVFVPSQSMRPALVKGDYMWVWTWPWQTYAVGDIVVFDSPTDGRMVKRIVAGGGDTVTYRHKKLTVNQTLLTGSELLYRDRYTEYRERQADAYREGAYTVLNEADAHDMKTAHLRDADNRSECTYPNRSAVCKVPSGRYFMMGDNRENSIDSRYYGSIPAEKIQGKVGGVLYHGSRDARPLSALQKN